MATGEITLYTNHSCPYAHRAHIALEELGTKFEEVIIDLETPREQWYLDINPRGLVPSIKFTSPATQKEEILTESGIIAQFLADADSTGHLLPKSTDGPLFRAKLNFFVDTWNTKIRTYMFTMFKAEGEEEREAMSKEWVATIQKEIEPLLEGVGPFFGGKDKLTLAEVMIAPFLLRIYALSEDGNVMPKSVKDGLSKLPNFSKWAEATIKNPSVRSIWDENSVVERTKQRIAKMKAQAVASTNGTK